MHGLYEENPVVYTNKAHCRDCYRCLRVCPVKAIRMEKGQAYVDSRRCIACGTCIRECPQGAKRYREDIEIIRTLLSSGKPVAASVAPSFAALYSPWEIKRLPSALRQLGFTHVSETALGAYFAAKETSEHISKHPGKAHICTACPAVMDYIEKYDPANITNLLPVVSPMIAHAEHIKRTYGKQTAVVFIGPCVAKKKEAEIQDYSGLVDCVITFEELNTLFCMAELELSECEESTFDEQPQGESRYFPISGGGLKTAKITADLCGDNILCADGFEEVQSALDMLRDTGGAIVLEPLFCPQGCINGPAAYRDDKISDINLYNRRKGLIDFARKNPAADSGGTPKKLPNRPSGFGRTISEESYSEEDIKKILERTGKYEARDELNCGACGYSSCREKAGAVLSGMAEVEMCIPYMRRLAEKRTDKIIETSPNGIVILDEQLRIIHMNPAFRGFFLTTDAIIGRPVSYLMDPEHFEVLASDRENKVTVLVDHPKYNLQCHQILYRLPGENQYIGIFVDVTHSKLTKEKLDKLQGQILEKTKELLEHQIHSAQTIAKFLGESTARTEEILHQFSRYAGDKQEPREEGRNRLPHK